VKAWQIDPIHANPTSMASVLRAVFGYACKDKSQNCKPLYQRKFFYLFTCEYCFSHYVAALFLLLTRFQMLYQGWRGFLISGFALVWIANVYMSVFNRLRLEIKAENLSIAGQAHANEEKGGTYPIPMGSPASPSKQLSMQKSIASRAQ